MKYLYSEWSRSKNTPVAMSTFNIQILVSKNNNNNKTRAPWRTTNSKAREGKIQDEPGTSLYVKK